MTRPAASARELTEPQRAAARNAAGTAARLVDRRFNRTRYDAEATVAAFTARLRDAVELDAIRADLLAAVTNAVQPAHASVWIKR